MKILHGISFVPALVIGPEKSVAGDEVRIGFTWESSAPRSKGPGVYLLYSNDRLVYVGSYQGGLARRWLYTRKQDLYHFKKKKILEELRTSASLRVFAQEEDAIKKQIGQAGNQWITSAGIESFLIRSESPPWNRIGKKKMKPGKPAHP
ncbi:MAG TPA: hypothetical protein VGM64_17970 [Lacunisphaera sp.]|jgi:hypothetical protein